MNTFDRCTKCVMSSSIPKVKFDSEGVCNFCRDQMFFTSEEKSINQSRKKIERILEAEKRKSGYDAIMCYSGGKDSTYTLMRAVKKYNLRVLSFTMDNGFIAPDAFNNINKVVDYLGVDQLTIRPSAAFFKSVIKASSLKQIYHPRTLIRISAGCNSCISLVNNLALRLALEKNIPLILAGFTPGQIPANAVIYKNNYQFLEESREPVLKRLREHVGTEVDEYYCLDKDILSKVKSYPHNINLLCLEDITEEEIVTAIEPLGWEKPTGVDGCSSNCELNTFNNYVHQKTFGYSPYELELSHLIRKGQMTRDEALLKINDQPKNKLRTIMEQLKIEDEEIGYWYNEK